ncbi:DUF1589 domain-containing protein [Rhodopirellula islandica]|uniref:DUF1589 domain-containing protein n=1 Tax=Rhodopirellula islandica TaxID=595434 RepID=UPI0012374672
MSLTWQINRPVTIARWNLAYTRSARRPGSTWHPRRCFGTKRGVSAVGHVIDVATQPASHHRQVEPGRRDSSWQCHGSPQLLLLACPNSGSLPPQSNSYSPSSTNR